LIAIVPVLVKGIANIKEVHIHMAKVIGIYSGKGGVGKSTVASLVALALAKSHSVCLVDLDINTPSIPVLFGGREELKNLSIFSMGFHRTGLLDYSGAILRRVVNDLTSKAREKKPEVIVIDMPPGLDDTHFEVVNLLKPSFFVLVIQPNKLSEEDAKRTSQLFTNLNIPIAGVIQNMSGDVFGEYTEGEVLGLKLLGSIPLDKKIAYAGGNGKIDTVKNPIAKIAESLFDLAGEADWKIVSKQMFEGVSYEELVGTEGYPEIEGDDEEDDEEDDETEDEQQDFYKGLNKKGIKKLMKRTELGFRGLKSWTKIRRLLMGMASTADHYFGQQDSNDLILDMNDEPTLRRMLYHLDDSNTGMFTIARPPNTQIPLFSGEIGTAHLYLEGKHYYNIPRVAYQTDQGEVVLFAHEIIPATVDSLNQYLEDGTLRLATNSKTPRYIPTVEHLESIEATFGHLTHFNVEWRKDHAELCGSA
jgi:ATP-binding protein involved in chromosome partitioning